MKVRGKVRTSRCACPHARLTPFAAARSTLLPAPCNTPVIAHLEHQRLCILKNLLSLLLAWSCDSSQKLTGTEFEQAFVSSVLVHLPLTIRTGEDDVS